MIIEEILEQILPPLGYECVDYEFTPQGLLRVYIDKPTGISIEDCALVSNHLSRNLLVEEIDYQRLEISSPGLDRVLKKEQDFIRFIGSLITLKTRTPVNQQRKFLGQIVDYKESTLTLSLADGTLVNIDFSNIEKSRIKPEF